MRWYSETRSVHRRLSWKNRGRKIQCRLGQFLSKWYDSCVDKTLETRALWWYYFCVDQSKKSCIKIWSELKFQTRLCFCWSDSAILDIWCSNSTRHTIHRKNGTQNVGIDRDSPYPVESLTRVQLFLASSISPSVFTLLRCGLMLPACLTCFFHLTLSNNVERIFLGNEPMTWFRFALDFISVTLSINTANRLYPSNITHTQQQKRIWHFTLCIRSTIYWHNKHHFPVAAIRRWKHCIPSDLQS